MGNEVKSTKDKIKSMKGKIIILIICIAIIYLLLIYGCSKPKEETRSGVKLVEETQEINSGVGVIEQKQKKDLYENCADLSYNIKRCSPYKCKSTDDLTKKTIIKEIIGVIDNKCNYVEKISNKIHLDCKFTEGMTGAISKYYKDIASLSPGSVDTGKKYAIDKSDKEGVSNPIEEAVRIGQCIKPISY